MRRAAFLCVAPLLLAGVGAAPLTLHGRAYVGEQPVAEAVVWLDAPEDSPAVPRPQAVLDQRNLSFFPHVLAVQLGTRVEFPNHDRVFHNVFSDHDGTKFDLGLYPVGMVKHVPFDRPGLSRVFCNIHPQMSAYVLVVDTPYFGVSDEQGRFEVSRVPPGPYRYHAWRPGSDVLDGSLIVSATSVLEVRW